MSPGPIYTFGPYAFDAQSRQLTRDGDTVPLADRHRAILTVLLAKAGEIVSKDALIAGVWADVAVTDNSLDQAMSSLRRRLGAAPDNKPFIETLARRGYRFRPPVVVAAIRESDDGLAALLGPYRMFVEGRAAIETLERAAVERARVAFLDIVSANADYAPAHIGLANALGLAFDAARVGGSIDVMTLKSAVEHAREACRLDPESGEAWATLAFVLSRAGASVDAIAAGRRATALEPENWRHYLRLSYAAWGDERLRAARATAKRLPGFGLAHWLAATVHVARGAQDEALRELMAGAAAQDTQTDGGRFSSVGLHLLLGLVHLSRGDDTIGEAEMMRELAFEPRGHIYSPQACAGAWSAIGAVRLRHGRAADAIVAFDESLARMPGYPQTLAVMSMIAEAERRDEMRTRLDRRLAELSVYGAHVEVAIALGVVDVMGGRHDEAADRIRSALASTSPGSAGWTIPIEPLLRVTDHSKQWAAVLVTLRERAS